MVDRLKKEAEIGELEALRKRLRNEMNNYTDDIALGNCKDFAEYKYLSGIVAGLGLSERHLLDLDTEIVEEHS